MLHHLLNASWHKYLLHGTYTPLRAVQTVVDLLVMLTMVVQMYSGICMSAHIFLNLKLPGGTMIARRLHIWGAYWGFLFISIHLGLHWQMFLSLMQCKLKIIQHDTPVLFYLGAAVAVYGIYAFFQRDMPTYLFLRTEFVFLDYEEPPWRFYRDTLAMMGTWVFLAHFFSKGLRKCSKIILQLPNSKG